MEKMTYRDFKLTVQSRNMMIASSAYGLVRFGKVALEELSEDTIKMFRNMLMQDRIKERSEVTLLGTYLYQTLFEGVDLEGKNKGEFGRLFKADFDKIQADPSQALRLILEFETTAEELGEWPWEYIYYPDGRERGFFIGAWTKLVLTRHIPRDEIIIKPNPKPLKILFVISQPYDKKVVDDSIVSTIEQLTSIETQVLRQPTKDSLFLAMRNRPHVLHFIGHGQYDKADEKGELMFVNANGMAEPVDDADLADCFMEHRPQLVLLQACEGARSESYRAFKGVALQLLYAGITGVIAMQYEIENQVATTFSRKFYMSLGEGKPIDAAVQDGRYEIGTHGTEDRPKNFSNRDFGSPVVYLQKSKQDLILIDTQSEREPTANLPPISQATSKKYCPYPDCQLLVIPGTKVCGCRNRRLLKQCPICGNVMRGGPDESCDWSHDDPKSAPAPSPVEAVADARTAPSLVREAGGKPDAHSGEGAAQILGRA